MSSMQPVSAGRLGSEVDLPLYLGVADVSSISSRYPISVGDLGVVHGSGTEESTDAIRHLKALGCAVVTPR
jgi:hypothetical protein